MKKVIVFLILIVLNSCSGASKNEKKSNGQNLEDITVNLKGDTVSSEEMLERVLLKEAESLNNWEKDSAIPAFFTNQYYERETYSWYFIRDTFSIRLKVLSKVNNKELLATVVKSQNLDFDKIDSLLEGNIPYKDFSIRDLAKLRLSQIKFVLRQISWSS